MMPGAKRRVMIVGRCSAATMDAMEILVRGGYEVAAFFDCDDVVATARRRKPDLLILSLAPDQPGHRRLHGELRSDPATRGIPLLVLYAVETPAAA